MNTSEFNIDNIELIKDEDSVLEFVNNRPHKNIFNDIYPIYIKKDLQKLEKIKNLFYLTKKYQESTQITILQQFFDFLKISAKIIKPPTIPDFEPIYLNSYDCVDFGCYCLTDFFYGTNYINLVLKKSFSTQNYPPNRYVDRLICSDIIGFLLFECDNQYENPRWMDTITRIYEVIFILFSDKTTINKVSKLIEKTLINPTSYERRVTNEMAVTIDPIKLSMYFNLIHILLDLWSFHINIDNTNSRDTTHKILSISIDYPHTTHCHLRYTDIKKYDKDNEENKRTVELLERCFFMLHHIIENIFLTTQYKSSLIESEMESYKKMIEKIDIEQNKEFNEQRKFEKNIILEKIASLSAHYYTFVEFISGNNIQNKVATFYELSAIWISSNLELAYVDNKTKYSAILENIIDNFSQYMHQNIKKINITLDNTITCNKLIIGNVNYVANPYTKIKCVDNLFNFIFNNNTGLEYVFYDVFRDDIIMSLVSYYVQLEANNGSLYYHKFNTRFKILHLIHFLKDVDQQYVHDLVLIKLTESTLFNKFIYILLSDFNYILSEGLNGIEEILNIEKSMNNIKKTNQISEEPNIDNIEPVLDNDDENGFENGFEDNMNIESVLDNNDVINDVVPVSDNDNENGFDDNMNIEPVLDNNDENGFEDIEPVLDNDDENGFDDHENLSDEEEQFDDEPANNEFDLNQLLSNMLNNPVNNDELTLITNMRQIEQLTALVNNDFNYIDELFLLFNDLMNIDKGAFLTEDICNHLIEILNYYLIKLAKQEPENMEEDIEKYNYNLYKILKNITYLYIQLSSDETFLKLMVSNIHSFSYENINIMMQKLQTYNMIDENDVKSLHLMLDQIKQIRSKEKLNILDELDEQDVLPDEFYDPIFCIPIKNPMMLPTSNNIMEKKSIMRHLISNQFDPTNRAPLTQSELESYNELDETKEKIKKFNKNRDDWVANYLATKKT